MGSSSYISKDMPIIWWSLCRGCTNAHNYWHGWATSITRFCVSDYFIHHLISKMDNNAKKTSKIVGCWLHCCVLCCCYHMHTYQMTCQFYDIVYIIIIIFVICHLALIIVYRILGNFCEVSILQKGEKNHFAILIFANW